jgi:diguanylate cyclase (GGDEF)-like protein
VEKEHSRATRHKKSYSIIHCDVDHFKNYNDKNGHVEGDKALIKTAAALQSRARLSDVVARYGGEEFVVLCPEVDGEAAKSMAEALRKKVASEKYFHGEKQPLGFVSISVGVASYPHDGSTQEEILKHADEALYEAKSGGRNQVRVFSVPMAKKICPGQAAQRSGA